MRLENSRPNFSAQWRTLDVNAAGSEHFLDHS